MLYKKEANSRDRKFNIEKGGGGSIVEIRKEICLKYPKMTKCLNTFVAHCSLTNFVRDSNFFSHFSLNSEVSEYEQRSNIY